MARRIFEIARDVGAPSRVVVDWCRLRGVSRDEVGGHMLRVSAALERAIRDRFGGESGGGAGCTAPRPAGPGGLGSAEAPRRR